MSKHRTLVAVIALAVVDVALFVISGVPRFKDAKAGADYVIGEICWMGFLVGVLALLVVGGVAVARRLRGRQLT